ncbi:MAG: TonB-dependent receptor, partial [Saprospiraceae bacterium]|nr:TonB-dependent receptor [Saprospiraceae bacterium]
LGLRYDNSDQSELSRTRNRRTTLRNIQLGDINENNLYGYLNLEIDAGKWLFEPGVRFDYFKFAYVDLLDSTYTHKSLTKAIVSPKFNTLYNLNGNVQLYFSTGFGFHSNDARTVLNNQAKDVLPFAFGSDLGLNFKPNRRIIANVALWYLFLQQEFVYVGDEGIVEPSGRTRRQGIDLGLRWQLTDWLFTHVDVNYSHGRSVDEEVGSQFIPLAPIWTSSGGLSFDKDNFSGGLRYRYLGDRPANEDNSIVAKGYSVFDFNLDYNWSRIGIGFTIENIFNTEWNETQFATESRLQFESTSVEEIHFTPGTPFFFKGKISYKF